MGGVTHFGISEGKGGLKHGSRPWLGMDIFWNCPFIHFAINHIRIHKNMQEIYNIFTMIDTILNKLFYKCSEQ